MISMSVAVRYYRPQESSDLGSRCIGLDNAEWSLGIGSFTENCKNGTYEDPVERVDNYEVMQTFRTEPSPLTIVFDSEDTLFAKFCKARREFSGFSFGLALFDVEMDDAANSCNAHNKYGHYTLLRAGRRALQYVTQGERVRNGGYPDCAKAPV
ncbi:uncharacterized protein LOC144162030 [Haemaphysalis longicornis]